MFCLRRAPSLDKLPILDALNAARGCIFCELEADDERRIIEDYLRESVMDPEHRSEIETVGLCNSHVYQMLAAGDVLGSAITIGALLRAGINAGLCGHDPYAAGVGRRGRLGGPRALGGLRVPAEAMPRFGQSCVFCRALEARVRRRTDTFMRLYAESDEFRREFAASRALCVPHGRQLAASAATTRVLRPELHSALVDDVTGVLNTTAAELGLKLDWFIQKHDYRYHDSDWNGSQDAPWEAARFLLGRAGAVNPAQVPEV